MRLSLRHLLLSSSFALVVMPHAAHAAEADNAAEDASRIVVTAANQPSSSATALSLSVRETPQSVTIINRERIEDFAITNVNDLLDQTIGINVERGKLAIGQLQKVAGFAAGRGAGIENALAILRVDQIGGFLGAEILHRHKAV